MKPFLGIGDHVLLGLAGSIAAADERLTARLTPAVIEYAVAAVPGGWADGIPYTDYLRRRLEAPRAFAEEAERARLAA